MASIQTGIRERAIALMRGTAGVTGFTINSNRFHERERSYTQEIDLNTFERSFEIMMRQRVPYTYNNPLCNEGLFLTMMEVNVGYVVGYGESEYEGLGEQSGGSRIYTIEDRAADDAQVIHSILGYQQNWAGVSPIVIDPYCTDPAPPTLFSMEYLEQYAMSRIMFQMLTRANQYTAYGPSV